MPELTISALIVHNPADRPAVSVDVKNPENTSFPEELLEAMTLVIDDESAGYCLTVIVQT